MIPRRLRPVFLLQGIWIDISGLTGELVVLSDGEEQARRGGRRLRDNRLPIRYYLLRQYLYETNNASENGARNEICKAL